MSSRIRIAIFLALSCCALISLAPQAAMAGAPAPASPTLQTDPFYQPTQITSTARAIVLCSAACQTDTCPQHGQGGEACGIDPEFNCNCRCVVALGGTHYCAQQP